MKLVRQFVLQKFPTHVAISQSQKPKYRNGIVINPKRVGKPKYQKISFQGLYNGSMHPNVRQKVMKTIHEYINRCIRNSPPIEGLGFDKSLVIRGMLYVPVNFGTVKMINDEINHHPIHHDEDYEPNWDILNAGTLWTKAFEDCLKKPDAEDVASRSRGAVIPEDNVKYLSGSGEMRVRFVDTFAERRIVFNLYIDDLNEQY